MKKSRLNRRINAVRKNIVVKKNLLNKLEKIKAERKKQSKKLPTFKLKKISNRNKNRLPTFKLKKISNRNKNRLPTFKLKKIPNKKQKPKNSLRIKYLKKLKKLNSIFPNSVNLRNNSEKSDDNQTCNFKNFHEEHIEIPKTYPGDLWVHNNLLVERDKPLERFDEDYLKEIYANHRKICYGV